MDVYDDHTPMTALDDTFAPLPHSVGFVSPKDGTEATVGTGVAAASQTAPRGPFLLRNLWPARVPPRDISINSASVSIHTDSAASSPLHARMRCFLVLCLGRHRFRPLLELFESGASRAAQSCHISLPSTHSLRLVVVSSAAGGDTEVEPPEWRPSVSGSSFMTLTQLQDFMHDRLREACDGEAQTASFAASAPLATLGGSESATSSATLTFFDRLHVTLHEPEGDKQRGVLEGVAVTMQVTATRQAARRLHRDAVRVAAPGGSKGGVVLQDSMWNRSATARGTLDATVASSGEAGVLVNACPLCSRTGPVISSDILLWHINTQHLRVRATLGKGVITLTRDAHDSEPRKGMLAMAISRSVSGGAFTRESVAAALVARAKRWDAPGHVHARNGGVFLFVSPARLMHSDAAVAAVGDVAAAMHQRASARVESQARARMSTIARAQAYNGMGNALPPMDEERSDVTPSNFATASALALQSIARDGIDALPIVSAAATATISQSLLPSSSTAASRTSTIVPPGSLRVYYHARTGQPYLPHEVDVDSDDDTHDAWILHETASRIASYGDVEPADAAFMMLWNEWTYAHPICADACVADACVAFATAHAKRLARAEYRTPFVMHLCNMWDYALVDASTLMRCLHIVDQAATAAPVAETAAEARPAAASAAARMVDLEDDMDIDMPLMPLRKKELQKPVEAVPAAPLPVVEVQLPAEDVNQAPVAEEVTEVQMQMESVEEAQPPAEPIDGGYVASSSEEEMTQQKLLATTQPNDDKDVADVAPDVVAPGPGPSADIATSRMDETTSAPDATADAAPGQPMDDS